MYELEAIPRGSGRSSPRPDGYTSSMSRPSPVAPPSPALLAIETATETLRLAVSVGERIVAHEEDGGAKASARLLPAVLGLLEQAGLSLRELDAIAFGRGPGAFTGLRTACSVAQGLAFGAGIPVLPVDTLLVLAEAARAAGGHTDVWATLDARMNEIYAARYRYLPELDESRQGANWQTLSAPALYDARSLSERLLTEGGDCVAGNALVVQGTQLDTANMNVMPEATPQAGALIRLAQAAWARGDAIDAALALPVYIRDKVAQTIAEREAAKA